MDDIVQTEIERAEEILLSLRGETVETIAVNSLEAEDAPFLGVVVSKLSPIIGNLLERRIIQVLDEEAGSGMSWIRQDPGFPDALLLTEDGSSTGAGYEVKAWYALSTELTGRFRESQNLLASRNVRLLVVAWSMSHIVYGTPSILDVLTTDAISVARARDEHYHNPPTYLCVEPGDTSGRTVNLRQTNVSGYRLQEASPEHLKTAASLVKASEVATALSHTPEAQELARDLMSQFSYRLDTNFAKIDRIDHVDIETFKARVLRKVIRGREVRDWATLLKALTDASHPEDQLRAAEVIQAIYDEL